MSKGMGMIKQTQTLIKLLFTIEISFVWILILAFSSICCLAKWVLNIVLNARPLHGTVWTVCVHYIALAASWPVPLCHTIIELFCLHASRGSEEPWGEIGGSGEALGAREGERAWGREGPWGGETAGAVEERGGTRVEQPQRPCWPGHIARQPGGKVSGTC